MDTTALDKAQRFEYYFSLFRIHTYWADFCNDKTYTPIHRSKAKNYLKKAVKSLKKAYQEKVNNTIKAIKEVIADIP